MLLHKENGFQIFQRSILPSPSRVKWPRWLGHTPDDNKITSQKTSPQAYEVCVVQSFRSRFVTGYHTTHVQKFYKAPTGESCNDKLYFLVRTVSTSDILHYFQRPCFFTTRQSVAHFSQQRHSFSPMSVHVEFVVGNLALGQVFLRLIQSSPVSNSSLPLLSPKQILTSCALHCL